MRLMLMLVATALPLAGCDGGEAEGGSQAAAPSEANVAPAGNGTPAALPTLRPGLWRTSIKGPGGEPETQEKCLTPEEARKMAEAPFAGMEGTETCRDVAVRREGDTFVTRASCPAGETSNTLESRTTGDFQNRYAVDMTLRIGGPEPRELRFKMDSTRVGDC